MSHSASFGFTSRCRRNLSVGASLLRRTAMELPAGPLALAGSALWCLAIVAAPIGGLSAVYAFFSTICHQDPARSWFVGGEPLPVCIRCASIYSGFFFALLVGIGPRVRWLQTALLLGAAEFLTARIFFDAAVLRMLTGMLLGAAAAPFVARGIQEMLHRGDPRDPV